MTTEMRVAVDVRPLCVPTFGIGRYTQSLLDRLIPDNPEIHWYLYADRPILIDYGQYENVTVRQFKATNRLLSLIRTQFYFSRWAKQDQIDVFWSPRHHLPLFLGKSVRKIVTIHDLVWRKYPETMMLANRMVEQLLVPTSVKVADKILCVSTSTANDLQQWQAECSNKLVVTALAADVLAAPVEPELNSPYLLFVGTLEPRKNLKRIIAAFAQAVPDIGDVKLVIVGAQGWMDSLAEQINSLGIQHRVVLTGHLEDAKLSGYYKNALALMLPSLYEGFGLPALEAMSHGVPVIGSNVSSLPEVVGAGGLLVNPESPAEIANAMSRLVNDDALRTSLGLSAKVQAAKFSWERTAQLTLDAILDR